MDALVTCAARIGRSDLFIALVVFIKLHLRGAGIDRARRPLGAGLHRALRLLVIIFRLFLRRSILLRLLALLCALFRLMRRVLLCRMSLRLLRSVSRLSLLLCRLFRLSCLSHCKVCVKALHFILLGKGFEDHIELLLFERRHMLFGLLEVFSQQVDHCLARLVEILCHLVNSVFIHHHTHYPPLSAASLQSRRHPP